MPDESVLRFSVRTFEVDAAGQVLPATYMRWFQEAAIFASASNGFDEERYRALGSTWIVRDFHLKVLLPLRLGERLDVFTWAGDVRRVLAHRQYSARRPNGEVVAVGEGEWVYMDRNTGRPRRIDRDPVRGFPTREEYVFEERDWGKESLGATWSEEDADRREHTVVWSELDGARHVNNAVYAQWVVDHIAAVCKQERASGGPGLVREMRLRFLRGARGSQRLAWFLTREREGVWRHETRLVETGETVTKALVEMT